jgi:hypothetical protein
VKPSAGTRGGRSADSGRGQSGRDQRREHGRHSAGATRSRTNDADRRPRRPPRRVSGPLRAGERLSLSLSAARAAAVALPLRPLVGRGSRPRIERKRPLRDTGAPAPGNDGRSSRVTRRAPGTDEYAPRIVRERRPGAETLAKPAIAGRLRSFLASLPDHAWLDRAVRGRIWIPLLGILLAGIVAAQVEILKLGASMGRSLEQNATLTTQNELLRASVASLSDDKRIEQLAGGMGMVVPPPGSVGFIATEPGGEVSAALGNLHAPDPSAFVTATPANGAVVTGPGTSTLSSASSGAVPTPSAGTSSATAAAGSTGAGAGGSSSVTGTSDSSTGVTGGAQSSASGPGTASPTSSPPGAAEGASQASSQPAATGAASVQPAGTEQQGSGG